MQKKKCSIWFNALGDWIKESSTKNSIGFQANTGGGLVGVDRHSLNGLIGAAAGYIRSSVHLEQDMAQAISEQFPVMVYTRNLFADFFDVVGLLLGSYIKNSNKRNVLDREAKSSPDLWELMPHLDMGFVTQFNEELILEPFASLDWAVLWQKAWEEHGSILNTRGKSNVGSISRFEVGLRGQAVKKIKDQSYLFQETISYVNITPFHFDQATIGIVGIPSFFTVATGVQSLNLFHIGAGITYQGQRVFARINYIGEFGIGFRNQAINGTIGTDF